MMMEPGTAMDADGCSEEMTIGLDCCPHYVPYGSDCDQCDEEYADEEMGLTVPTKRVRTDKAMET